MRISDWSSDVCSSDLALVLAWLSQRWLQRRVVHPLRQLRDQVGEQRGAGHASRTHELDDLRQGIAALRRRMDEANHSADERVRASASEVVQQSAQARAAAQGESRFLAAVGDRLRQQLPPMPPFLGALDRQNTSVLPATI